MKAEHATIAMNTLSGTDLAGIYYTNHQYNFTVYVCIYVCMYICMYDVCMYDVYMYV